MNSFTTLNSEKSRSAVWLIFRVSPRGLSNQLSGFSVRQVTIAFFIIKQGNNSSCPDCHKWYRILSQAGSTPAHSVTLREKQSHLVLLANNVYEHERKSIKETVKIHIVERKGKRCEAGKVWVVVEVFFKKDIIFREKISKIFFSSFFFRIFFFWNL